MPKHRTEDLVHVGVTDHYIQRRPRNDRLLGPLPEDHDSKPGEPVLHWTEVTPLPERDLYLATARIRAKGEHQVRGIAWLKPLHAFGLLLPTTQPGLYFAR